jgi:hypothetical protein
VGQAAQQRQAERRRHFFVGPDLILTKVVPLVAPQQHQPHRFIRRHQRDDGNGLIGTAPAARPSPGRVSRSSRTQQRTLGVPGPETAVGRERALRPAPPPLDNGPTDLPQATRISIAGEQGAAFLRSAAGHRHGEGSPRPTLTAVTRIFLLHAEFDRAASGHVQEHLRDSTQEIHGGKIGAGIPEDLVGQSTEVSWLADPAAHGRRCGSPPPHGVLPLLAMAWTAASSRRQAPGCGNVTNPGRGFTPSFQVLPSERLARCFLPAEGRTVLARPA